MIVLGLRTDKPQAELYLYKNKNKVAELRWLAHLKLAETLNTNIEKILNKSSIAYGELEGVAVFEGPGSFTGLRIGLSVANALAYALDIPIITKGGENWLPTAIKSLQKGQNDQIAIAKYGAPVRTTQPRK